MGTQKFIVSAETMESVLKFVPNDTFKLGEDLLNHVYTVINVREYKDAAFKGFMVTMQNEVGRVINISSSALKRSRVLTGDSKPAKFYKKTKSVALRSNCDELWYNKSVYGHAALGMTSGEEFVLPDKLKLVYAILFEDKVTKEPLISPYLYEGYAGVVKAYTDLGKYPSMDDFRMELRKTDGRLECLPKELQDPTPHPWVKGELSDFRHCLVWEKVA